MEQEEEKNIVLSVMDVQGVAVLSTVAHSLDSWNVVVPFGKWMEIEEGSCVVLALVDVESNLVHKKKDCKAENSASLVHNQTQEELNYIAVGVLCNP